LDARDPAGDREAPRHALEPEERPDRLALPRDDALRGSGLAVHEHRREPLLRHDRARVRREHLRRAVVAAAHAPRRGGRAAHRCDRGGGPEAGAARGHLPLLLHPAHRRGEGVLIDRGGVPPRDELGQARTYWRNLMDGPFVLRVIILIMVAVILSTIALAALSYAAFRLRERRRPRVRPVTPEGLLFFERVHVVPPRQAADADSARAAETASAAGGGSASASEAGPGAGTGSAWTSDPAPAPAE